MSLVSKKIESVLNRNLVFVHGKGGVGKTTVSQAIALGLAAKSKRTLWVALEDPTQPEGELLQVGPTLWHLNCAFSLAFEEYAALKIGGTRLTRLFVQNKLMQYLAKAAPGVHEIVLLGKIWFERTHYDHVIVDMPSMGYGLAMFQSTENFSALFGGGPLHRDAEAMLETLRSPRDTGHVIVSLPEEMPLRESLELNEFLVKNFAQNPSIFLVNRLFPAIHTGAEPHSSLTDRANPLANSVEDYALMRSWLETYNLRIWKEAGVEYGQLPQIAPQAENQPPLLIERLLRELQAEAYL